MFEKFLSKYGRKVYIPKGFTYQSEEANKTAIINATAGVYQVNNKIKTIEEISENFNLSDEEIVQYVPASGLKLLRETWHKHINNFGSLPVVTNGISNSLYNAGSLIIDKNDEVFIPYLHWDAYNSIFNLRLGCNLKTYDNFDLTDLKNKLSKKIGKKIIVFNYPNNPTGYTLSKKEFEYLKNILTERCNLGDTIITIIDDAYFRFFYTENCYKKSLFEELSNLHENLLAIKCDGVSKEYCAWGMRVGFITFGSKNIIDYSELEHKASAVNRGTLSSVSMNNQIILNKVINIHNCENDEIFINLQERFDELNRCLNKYKNSNLEILPHNSGYFVCLKTTCDTELLRKNLLEKYKIGIIRYDDNHIRLAFSAINKENIDFLIKTLCEEIDLLKKIKDS